MFWRVCVLEGEWLREQTEYPCISELSDRSSATSQISLVTSFQVLADICPHHKPMEVGRVLATGSLAWGSVQCWNSEGCRCLGRAASAFSLPACTTLGSSSSYQLGVLLFNCTLINTLKEKTQQSVASCVTFTAGVGVWRSCWC